MSTVTIICYLFSLLSYAMGYLKLLYIQNTVIEHVSTYDYYIQVSLVTSYFVSAIFFAVIGFLFFCVRNNSREHDSVKIMTSNTLKKPLENRMIEEIRA